MSLLRIDLVSKTEMTQAKANNLIHNVTADCLPCSINKVVTSYYMTFNSVKTSPLWKKKTNGEIIY